MEDVMLDIRSELGTKLPPKPKAEAATQAKQVKVDEKTAAKSGTLVILSPAALKLSRELQAIQSNPEMQPEAQHDAAQKLRQLALDIMLGQ